MKDWHTGGGVYIALGATDMRKSVNGLSLLVEEYFELDLFSGSLFAFCNRKRNMVNKLPASIFNEETTSLFLLNYLGFRIWSSFSVSVSTFSWIQRGRWSESS